MNPILKKDKFSEHVQLEFENWRALGLKSGKKTKQKTVLTDQIK